MHDLRNKPKLLVLAGGYGRRLKSIISDVPKPMAPVGSHPFLKLQLTNWLRQGVQSFIFLLGYKADMVIDIVNKESKSMMKECDIQFVIESQPLGTGGAVANAIRVVNLKGDFLVANADTWLESGIAELWAAEPPALATVEVMDAGRYGVVDVNENGNVMRFVEKNSKQGAGQINAGLYKLNSNIFEDWSGAEFSIEHITFPQLADANILHAVKVESRFIDIGVPKDYLDFCKWAEENVFIRNES